jgi:hypothetical protein
MGTEWQHVGMARAQDRAAVSDGVGLHSWERLLIALFGWMLVAVEGTSGWRLAVQAVGWVSIGAALGVAELLMAGYYYLRYRRQFGARPSKDAARVPAAARSID